MPVSLSDLKEHLRIDDSASDGELGRFLKAAIGSVDGYEGIGYCCCLQTWRLQLNAFPCAITLPLGPVADDATVSVRYVNTDGVETTLDPAAYRLSGGVIDPAFGTSFPASRCIRNAVTVDFEAGKAPDDVPETIKQVILETAAEWYANRETGAVRELSQTALDMLEPYRFRWMAS